MKRTTRRVTTVAVIAALLLSVAAAVAHARRDTDWPCPGCKAPIIRFR